MKNAKVAEIDGKYFISLIENGSIVQIREESNEKKANEIKENWVSGRMQYLTEIPKASKEKAFL